MLWLGDRPIGRASLTEAFLPSLHVGIVYGVKDFYDVHKHNDNAVVFGKSSCGITLNLVSLTLLVDSVG